MQSTPDRLIVVPSPFRDGFPARLSIFSPDGETATISLSVGLEILARGEGFRRPEYGPYTWLDAPESSVVDTFGGFLAHAFESYEDDARDGWSILTDAASDWADELVSFGIELAKTDHGADRRMTSDVRSAVIAVGGLCSIADLARRWGVSPQRARVLVRKPGFPEPILSEGNIELWPADEADAWKAARPLGNGSV